MAANKIQRLGPIATSLIAFFEANPDEELTIRQAATKFGVTEGAVRMALYRGTTGLEFVNVMRRPEKGRMQRLAA